jgi:hypothetical protein
MRSARPTGSNEAEGFAADRTERSLENPTTSKRPTARTANGSRWGIGSDDALARTTANSAVKVSQRFT